MLLKNCENNPLLGYWPTIHHLISKIVLNFKLAVFAFLRSIICSTIIKRKCVERNSSLCRLGAEDNCENFLLSAVALGLPVCHTFCTLLKSTHATELTRPTVILSINWRIEQDNAQRDSLCGTSSHRQSDSDDSQGLDKFTEWWSSIGNISKSLWRFAISLIIRLVTRYVARRSYHFSSSSYLKSCEANAEILGSCACLIRSEWCSSTSLCSSQLYSIP